MTPVSIPLSKRKILLAFLFACAVALWIAFSIESTDMGTIGRFRMILFMALFSAGTVVLAIKLFDQRPGLVLNEEGVHRLGEFHFRPVIPWKHITRCSIAEADGVKTRTLLIHVDNVEEVLARLSTFDRWRKRSHIARHGTPHSIESGDLQINTQQLKALIENGIEAYRRKATS